MNKKVTIHDISEMPETQSLETALHPKRMRMRRPSTTAPSVVPPSSPARLSPILVKCEKREMTPSPSSASSIQSPSSAPCPQHLRNEDTKPLTNYGSEDDSDKSDDEETLPFPVIPRVLQSLIETPLDQDEDPAENVAVATDVSSTATDLPTNWCEFEWRPFPESLISPKSRRETFSQTNVGPTTPHDDPYDIFIDIWDRQIMEHIVSETNKYAQQVMAKMIANHTLQPRSRIAKWKDTTVDELYAYFGIILAMAIVVKTRIEEYWSSIPDIFQTPGFNVHMSVDRFLLLSKCLHFNDNDNMFAVERTFSEAKLFKIQPILTHLNNKFQELYTPAQNIALDESILTWKGLLEMSQLIPNKAARRGIKTYEICECQTGYLWRFEIHGHNKSLPASQQDDPLDAVVPATVLRLLKGLENKGYTVWMDNFYNSPCLARRLKSLGFDCVGTLRTDREFVPQELQSLTKQNMRPGQITGFTSGDVDVMVWRDANRVGMISTYHGNGQQTVRRSTKPILILDYNNMMGGLDKKDQLLAMYPVERQRTKVWYKILFRRLLNISVLNSYIIHRHSSSLSHRDFRIQLIKSLLSKHSSTSLPFSFSPTMATSFELTHHLAEFPMGMGHQRLRRACSACKKLARTYCVGCNKTVCMEPCFLIIHQL